MRRVLSIFVLFVCLNVISASADDYPRNHDIDIQHYTFKIFLKEGSDMIRGETLIDIRFKKDGITGFSLDLIGKTEQSENKGMTVESVTLEDEPLHFLHDNGKLTVAMRPSVKGKRLVFRINYMGIPEDGLIISENKFGDRTFFADNWPNRARHWIPAIDHPYEKATCDFLVYAPEKFQVISNGYLAEVTNLDGNMKLTHWKETVPISTKLMVIGVSRFAWEVVDIYKGIQVQTWVFPQNRDKGFYDFARSKRALEFFDNKIGPYPYEKLANVQSKTRYGGMENASAIFYNQNSVSGERGYENTVVHEIAHQWFGDSVTEADWHHVWLSEGFATYLTHLFNEFYFGRDRLVAGLERDKRRIFRYYESNPDSPVIDPKIDDLNHLLSTNSYQKGSWFLHMLRGMTGDDIFFEILQNYYKEYRNSIAWTDDFLRIAEETSGMDLEWFFNQWLYQPGQPNYFCNWTFEKKNKTLKIDIEQVQGKGLFFSMPLEIGIFIQGDDTPHIEVLKVDEIKKTFVLELESEPSKLVVDPNTKVLLKAEVKRN